MSVRAYMIAAVRSDDVIMPPGFGSPATHLTNLCNTDDVCCDWNLSHKAHAWATSLMKMVSSTLDHPPCDTLVGPHTSETTQLLPIEDVDVDVCRMGGLMLQLTSGASKLGTILGGE